MYCVVLAALASRPCLAGSPLNAWDLSDSDQAINHTSAAWAGDRTLYLWTLNVNPLWEFDHAEFGLSSDLEIVSFTPRALWVNHGTASDLLLDRSECMHEGGEVVGELVVRDVHGAGGRVCFVDASTGMLCTRWCAAAGPWLSIAHMGFASDGLLPICSGYGHEGCGTVAVDDVGWGRVKATYR
jgi:hypothetical protein